MKSNKAHLLGLSLFALLASLLLFSCDLDSGGKKETLVFPFSLIHSQWRTYKNNTHYIYAYLDFSDTRVYVRGNTSRSRDSREYVLKSISYTPEIYQSIFHFSENQLENYIVYRKDEITSVNLEDVQTAESWEKYDPYPKFLYAIADTSWRNDKKHHLYFSKSHVFFNGHRAFALQSIESYDQDLNSPDIYNPEYFWDPSKVIHKVTLYFSENKEEDYIVFEQSYGDNYNRPIIKILSVNLDEFQPSGSWKKITTD